MDDQHGASCLPHPPYDPVASPAPSRGGSSAAHARREIRRPPPRRFGSFGFPPPRVTLSPAPPAGVDVFFQSENGLIGMEPVPEPGLEDAPGPMPGGALGREARTMPARGASGAIHRLPADSSPALHPRHGMQPGDLRRGRPTGTAIIATVICVAQLRCLDTSRRPTGFELRVRKEYSSL
jgi:hypothetical protein